MIHAILGCIVHSQEGSQLQQKLVLKTGYLNGMVGGFQKDSFISDSQEKILLVSKTFFCNTVGGCHNCLPFVYSKYYCYSYTCVALIVMGKVVHENDVGDV